MKVASSSFFVQFLRPVSSSSFFVQLLRAVASKCFVQWLRRASPRAFEAISSNVSCFRSDFVASAFEVLRPVASKSCFFECYRILCLRSMLEVRSEARKHEPVHVLKPRWLESMSLCMFGAFEPCRRVRKRLSRTKSCTDLLNRYMYMLFSLRASRRGRCGAWRFSV